MKRFVLTVVSLMLLAALSENAPLFPDEEWTSGLIDLGNSGDDIFYILYKSRNVSLRGQRLIVWFQGGPGCSGFIANMVENGPYLFNKTFGFNRNPHSWNEAGDLLFIDQPVGTGFSRMQSEATNCLNESCVAKDMYIFFAKFVETFPEYKTKPLYFFGQSYAGQYIPAVGAYLVKAHNRDLNLKGVGIGNGLEDFIAQIGTHPTYGYETGLLTFGEKVQQQVDALVCQIAILTGKPADVTKLCLNAFEEMGRKVPNPNDIRDPEGYKQLEKVVEFLKRNETRAQLNVRMREYELCNGTIYNRLMVDMYTYTTDDLTYLVQHGINTMLYHGDNDAVCNWRGGLLVTEELQWSGKSAYNAQGFKEIVINGKAQGQYKQHENLAFVRVYNAGHFSPYNQPVATLHILNWLIGEFH